MKKIDKLKKEKTERVGQNSFLVLIYTPADSPKERKLAYDL